MSSVAVHSSQSGRRPLYVESKRTPHIVAGALELDVNQQSSQARCRRRPHRQHDPERYANGPGGLDWASQPNSSSRFIGAPMYQLSLSHPDDTSPAAALFGAATVTSRPFGQNLSAYLHLSRCGNQVDLLATRLSHCRATAHQDPHQGRYHGNKKYSDEVFRSKSRYLLVTFHQ